MPVAVGLRREPQHFRRERERDSLPKDASLIFESFNPQHYGIAREGPEMTFNGDIRGELGSITTGLSFVITFVLEDGCAWDFCRYSARSITIKAYAFFFSAASNASASFVPRVDCDPSLSEKSTTIALALPFRYLVLRLMAAAASEASAAISLDCAKLWKAIRKGST